MQYLFHWHVLEIVHIFMVVFLSCTRFWNGLDFVMKLSYAKVHLTLDSASNCSISTGRQIACSVLHMRAQPGSLHLHIQLHLYVLSELSPRYMIVFL